MLSQGGAAAGRPQGGVGQRGRKKNAVREADAQGGETWEGRERVPDKRFVQAVPGTAPNAYYKLEVPREQGSSFAPIALKGFGFVV